MRRSTVIFVLPCTDRDRVAAVVDSWGSDGQALGFPGMPRLHFASVTLSNPADGFPDLLLLECCYDGSARELTTAIAARCGKALHEALGHCRGYGHDSYEEGRVRRYLWRHRRSPSLCQIGTRQFTLDQILAEQELRERLDGWLDGALRSRPFAVGSEIHDAAQQMFGVTPSRDRLMPVFPPSGPPEWRPAPSLAQEKRTRILALIGHALPLAVLLLIVALATGAAAYLALGLVWKPVAAFVAGAIVTMIALVLIAFAGYRLTSTAALQPKVHPPYVPTASDVIERAETAEDRYVQNHLPSIVTLRPGFLAKLRLWLIFFTVRFRFDTAFAESGRVFGLNHIHCSHWTLLDRGRRLLFMGNYDGSYGLYLQDFATEIGSGVREFWGGGYGYPGLDVAKFQRWGRASQLRHRVWYGAYRDLSLVNVENNHAICRGLTRRLDPEAAATWLRRFAVAGEREVGT